MKRSTKKGFTIVELVIVIAIIAILAAVLIPTFASLIQKANTSADIQACKQMNTYLAMNEVESPKSIDEVYKALGEGGMTAKDYHPLSNNTYYFWDAKLNRVLYTNDKYEVIFPEEYKSANKTNGWRSLSGEINQTKVTVTNGVATVTTAEELYWLSKNMTGVKEVKLPAAIDVMGANIAFSFESSGNYKISGDTGVTTITGLVQNTNKLDGDGTNNKAYASGFVALIQGNANVTISNITIKASVIGNLEIGGVGALVGRIEKKDGTPIVKIENCHVEDTIVNGKNKVGAVVGSASGNVEINNCTVNKVTVNCSEGESGKVVGALYGNDGKLMIDKDFSQWVTATTLNLVAGEHEREVKTGTVTYKIRDESKTAEGYEKLVRVWDDNTNAPEIKDSNPRYRMFASDAYVVIVRENQYNTAKVDRITINKVVTKSTNNDFANVSDKKLDNENISINILDFVK